MKKLALAFSYFFNPLFIPAYATLFYFFVTHNYFHRHEVYLVFLQVLILTVLIPISVFYLLRSLSVIKEPMLPDKKERRAPLAIYALLLYVLIKHGFSTYVIKELHYYLLGVLISTLIALALAVFRYRISLHVMGVSSLTAFAISISAYYHIQFLAIIAFLIISCGFVATARLDDKNHGWQSIAAGALTGLLPQIALWLVWLF